MKDEKVSCIQKNYNNFNVVYRTNNVTFKGQKGTPL